MKKSLRAIALYNWPEQFNFSDHREFLSNLVEDARIEPTKLEFKVGENKRKRVTVSKRKGFRVLLKEALPFTTFEFCRPIDGNYLNLESDMSGWTAEYGKEYMIANSPEKLSVRDLVRHISLVCKHFTPQYGVSVQMQDSFFFLTGAGTNIMSKEDRRRADAIGYYIRGDHLGSESFDRLIDIFELNVLNLAHLKREVFGQPLATWIKSGKRGELVEINSKVAAWLVPDDIRPLIRKMFFSHGLLEA